MRVRSPPGVQGYVIRKAVLCLPEDFDLPADATMRHVYAIDLMREGVRARSRALREAVYPSIALDSSRYRTKTDSWWYMRRPDETWRGLETWREDRIPFVFPARYGSLLPKAMPATRRD